MASVLAMYGNSLNQGGRNSEALAAWGEARTLLEELHEVPEFRARAALDLAPVVLSIGYGHYTQGDNQAGSCVAVRGDMAIVSAPLEDIPGPNGLLGNAGAVFVYRRKGTSWQRVQTLLKPNFATRDSFGSSCAMDADRIVIGERGAIDEGAAHVVKRSGELWQLEQTIVASDATY